MKRLEVEELKTHSDIQLLSNVERCTKGDDCAERSLAEIRRRLYQLRKLEMFYHLGPAVDRRECMDQ
jgi:chromosome condensin MukBEF MukE localization factor